MVENIIAHLIVILISALKNLKNKMPIKALITAEVVNGIKYLGSLYIKATINGTSNAAARIKQENPI